MDKPNKELKDLMNVLLDLEDPKECFNFLSDLCTPTELKSLSDRWKVAQLINKGYDYRSISEMTQCSTATITRVARAMKFGRNGYSWALHRHQ